MPIAGALVTDHGGLMSHAALVCREYGIAAVVGVAGATAHVTDGELLTVDPSMSRVLISRTKVTAPSPRLRRPHRRQAPAIADSDRA